MIRFLLKLWPAFAVILAYVLWVFVVERIILKKLRKSKIIDAEYVEVGKEPEPFSLNNRRFLWVIYLSLIALIISFLFLAVNTPNIEQGNYVPAQIKDGKIIPSKIVE